MTRWFNQAVTSKSFKQGFDKFAYDNEEDAVKDMKAFFNKEERKGALLYRREFGSDKFVIKLPNGPLKEVIGKGGFLYGLPSGFVYDFAISESFEVE